MDKATFKEAMRKLGYTEDSDSIFGVFDADGNGTVDFQVPLLSDT